MLKKNVSIMGIVFLIIIAFNGICFSGINDAYLWPVRGGK